MVKLAIRGHPRVPVADTELEQWLAGQAKDLQAQAPHGKIGLSRLIQASPATDCHIGWLVELELADGDPLLAGSRLADVLRDMRLLGLEPTLLAPTHRG